MPRVAFLTHTPPLPAVSGERLRNWHLIRDLARRGWEVSLFSLVPEGGAFGPAEQSLLDETCAEVVIASSPSGSRRRTARLARDVVLHRALHEDYFVTSRGVQRCRDWLSTGSHELLVVGQLYMAPYVPKQLLERSVLDSHNAEARRIGKMADVLGSSPRGLAARLQRAPVTGFERAVASQVARVVAVSEQDRVYFEGLAPGRVDLVPNGVDCAGLSLREQLPADPRLLFIGSLDYSANVDALAYLAEQILPHLRARTVTVDVVGSNPRKPVHELARRFPTVLELAGYVDDPEPYWRRARALVVPLRIGGGTRLKILEAMARGVPVVTTTIGCEGLEVADGEELLVADEPSGFAGCVARLLDDDDLCRSLAVRGRQKVEALYDWRPIGAAFERSLVAAMKAS